MTSQPAESATKRTGGEWLVYARSTGGHRQSYLDIFGPMFGLEPVSGKMDAATLRRLVAADRLLFATLDDHMASFAAVAASRSILRRPTAALFLRPQKCFESGRWYYPLKRHAFRILRRLPHLTMATITPFDVAPRYGEVAHVGVPDPQYWDLSDGAGLPAAGRTDLSDEVVAKAAGRRVLCLVGGLSADKGLPFLADTLERHPQIAERLLVVAAGRVHASAPVLAARLEAAGALVVDRFVSDAELASLYGVAELIWACYAPGYDQASGIFGRAMQYGVPPLVREGSLIATFAAMNGIDHVRVAYGEDEALAELLWNCPARFDPAGPFSRRDRSDLVHGWKQSFVKAISNGLGIASFGNSHRVREKHSQTS